VICVKIWSKVAFDISSHTKAVLIGQYKLIAEC